VSEQLHNGTSAQLGYTVGRCWKIHNRRQIKTRHTTKTKHNPEKANNAKYSKTKLPWAYSTMLPNPQRVGNVT